MTSKLDTLERFHAKTRNAWRAWLRKNHRTSPGVWLVTYKKATGKPRIDYEEAVEELLCFGWVDSLPRALDAERSMLLCTPRKPKARWSRLNRERVAKLEAEGKMAPRGLEVVALAKKSGAWDALNEVESLTVPPDLKAAFKLHPGSESYFDAFPRSVTRAILEWILQAKKPETRAKRVAETAQQAAKNIRANQWRSL